VVCFDNRIPSITSLFMDKLIKLRAKFKKEMPMYALSLKVLSNSVFGSLGYSNSHIYSPSCAASITAIGRHCIKLARGFFEQEGLTVLYGDTDSCMVSKDATQSEVHISVKRALEGLHSYFEGSSLHMMKMVVEECYAKGVLVDKKRYCMLLKEGTIKKVGISLSRRDVSGLCREAAEVTIHSVFKDDIKSGLKSIFSFVSAVSYMAVNGGLTLSDVSRYVKKDGISCYMYTKSSGEVLYVPETEASLCRIVDCDIAKALKAVALEIERFTIPCRFGTVSEIMLASSLDIF